MLPHNRSLITTLPAIVSSWGWSKRSPKVIRSGFEAVTWRLLHLGTWKHGTENDYESLKPRCVFRTAKLQRKTCKGNSLLSFLNFFLFVFVVVLFWLLTFKLEGGMLLVWEWWYLGFRTGSVLGLITLDKAFHFSGVGFYKWESDTRKFWNRLQPEEAANVCILARGAEPAGRQWVSVWLALTLCPFCLTFGQGLLPWLQPVLGRALNLSPCFAVTLLQILMIFQQGPCIFFFLWPRQSKQPVLPFGDVCFPMCLLDEKKKNNRDDLKLGTFSTIVSLRETWKV